MLIYMFDISKKEDNFIIIIDFILKIKINIISNKKTSKNDRFQ